MAKKQKQMEIPNIDNTPLRRALAQAAEFKEKSREADENLEAAGEKVLEELEAIGREEIKYQGFKFRVKHTPEKKKLSITPVADK